MNITLQCLKNMDKMLLPPILITILQLELEAGATDGPDRNRVYKCL